MLKDLDLSHRLTKSEEIARMDAAQRRLLTLRLHCAGLLDGSHTLGPPVCVVMEGWDASGKGGCIRRLVSPLDPRHVRVATYAAPTPDEKRHHFLSRFWPALPGWGGMTVMDRSWYGRVLVERVEGFATVQQWERAYGEIATFERSLVDEGMVLIKFWLHISDAEQLDRFHERQSDPLKAWKLTDEDWRNRSKRADYTLAIDDMVQRTGTESAPWDVIAAEDKRLARVTVVETVCSKIEAGLRTAGIDVPA